MDIEFCMGVCDFCRVFGAIIFGGMHVGRTGSNAPDFTKGRRAAGRLFSIIERKPVIDAKLEEGQKLVRSTGIHFGVCPA